MTTPRRRLVRPGLPSTPTSADRQRRLQRLRSRLDRERAALARWMARLRRAFHAVEKSQRRTCRLERQIARLEEGPCLSNARSPS